MSRFCGIGERIQVKRKVCTSFKNRANVLSGKTWRGKQRLCGVKADSSGSGQLVHRVHSKGFTYSVKHGQMWVTLLTSNHTLLIVPSHASVSELSYLWAAPEPPQTAGNMSLCVGHMTARLNYQTLFSATNWAEYLLLHHPWYITLPQNCQTLERSNWLVCVCYKYICRYRYW